MREASQVLKDVLIRHPVITGHPMGIQQAKVAAAVGLVASAPLDEGGMALDQGHDRETGNGVRYPEFRFVTAEDNECLVRYPLGQRRRKGHDVIEGFEVSLRRLPRGQPDK